MSSDSIRDGTLSKRLQFFAIWIICGFLIVAAVWNLRRGCQVYPEFEATMQRFSQLRWLTLLNCLLQLLCFLG